MSYPRKTTAIIDLQALSDNYLALKTLLKPHTKLMAIVKANAYGHGAIEVANHLQKIGADFLGVACVHEAVELRQAGITLDILNIGPTFLDEVEAIFEYNFIATVFSLDLAQKISQIAKKLNKIAKIHVKINTGMNRLGVDYYKAFDLICDIKKLPNIEIAGLFTHFADADSFESQATKIQIEKFEKFLQKLSQSQIKIAQIHACNSAGVLYWPQAHYDLVRVGMSLYGYPPTNDKKLILPITLKPVMTLKTYVSFTREAEKNAPISYGGTYLTEAKTIIVTLSIGYADGLRRAPFHCQEMLLDGKRVKIVGRVCMDQTMLDVGLVSNIKIGDEVVIIGSQGYNKIDAWQVAEKWQTSVYEVLTSISSRVERIYTK